MDLFAALTGKISHMSYVNRYSSHAVVRPENVAEHSWWVAYVSLLIGLDLESAGVTVSQKTLLVRALLHDVSEISSGDIIRSYKHTNEQVRQAMHEADDLNTLRHFSPKKHGYGRVGNFLMNAWRQAKADDLEGDIISFADMVTVVLYCRQEAQLGNRALGDVVLKELYETWMHKYHSHAHLKQYMDQIFPGRRYFDPLHYAEPGASVSLHTPEWGRR